MINKHKQELKEIAIKTKELSNHIKSIKSRVDLLEAGRNLSVINYSLLSILKEHEMDVVNMIDEIDETDENKTVFLNKLN